MTIQLDGIPLGSRVAVAMSGGVDSSVAACVLANSGYEVVGITLQLYDQGAMAKKKGACCAGQDIYDAKMVANRMGFDHYVLNYESVFKKQVIDDFVQSYVKGETPLPCVQCNQHVKFRDLLKTAKELQAKCLVTGHYVQRMVIDGQAQMHRAADHRRDQSYFLFATTQQQLDYLRFPLGGFEDKNYTRALAKTFGLITHDKPDSQDICFVTDGDYGAVVTKFYPAALDIGTIEDQQGNILGHHTGIINFTIGQRKGLNISAPHPLYVIKIDPATKTVIVGSKAELAVTKLFIRDVNFLGNPSLNEKGEMMDSRKVQVKIRSTHNPVDATIFYPTSKEITESSLSDQPNSVYVILDEPEYGVAYGQACVFYEKDHVLGGGWICSGP